MKLGPACSLALLLLAVALPAPAAGPARPGHDPDWPCIQVLVPSLSPGLLWQGPPLEEAGPRWRRDPAVESLVKHATDRHLSPDRLEGELAALVEAAGAERDAALTALFARLFDAYDRRRSTTIAAIKRYARGQRAQQARIAELLTQLDSAPPGSAQARELQQALLLQRRILDDRRQALTAVCEQPALVERELGEWARAIAAHLG